MTTLEIAIETFADALAAQQGGADSIELSYDLAQDGLTPDPDLVAKIRAAVAIEFHVIVRPHNNGFVYSQAELDIMLRDVERFVALGVDGIVFGAHQPEGKIDVAIVQQIAAVTKPKTLTLHRALDSAVNPLEALRQLTNSVDRVLTSGPDKTAWEGRVGLSQWVDQFRADYQFIAAGRIRAKQLPALVTQTKVAGIHVGSAARKNGKVDAETIRNLKHLLV